jgi:hypothetical protein
MISGKCIDNCNFGFLYNDECVTVCPTEASKVYKNLCMAECPAGFKDDKGKCVSDISVKDIKSLFQFTSPNNTTNSNQTPTTRPDPTMNVNSSSNSQIVQPKPDSNNISIKANNTISTNDTSSITSPNTSSSTSTNTSTNTIINTSTNTTINTSAINTTINSPIDISTNTTNTTIAKQPELPPIILADQTYDLVNVIMNNAPPADVATTIVSNIARIDINNTVVDSSKIQTIGTVLDSAIK